MDTISKNVTIVGLGKSGAACARFLRQRGSLVTVTDQREEGALTAHVPEMRNLGVRLALGGHPPEVFAQADMIVLSPGVPHTLGPFERAREKGVPVIGEIELASRYIGAPIVAVTGTNGKTTTTTLLGEMLRGSGLKVFVGGNIGTPLIEYAAGPQNADVVVAEVSSFQLDTTDSFRPRVGVLLNITEDHLDRYPDFNAYGESKGRIFKNQGPEDVAVLNGAAPAVCAAGGKGRGRRLFFNPSDENDCGAFVSGTQMHLRPGDAPDVTLDISEVRLTGAHNLENMAAASLAALSAGGTAKGIQSALKDFRGLPHRIEYVATVGGVRYFDDSKATNVDAVARALASFQEPVVLIMGGRGKGSDFGILSDLVRRHTRQLIALGETAEEIRSALNAASPGGVRVAATMEEAVACAAEAARFGDVVLLSPACSSFDMYRSYARRGEHFTRSVKQLLLTG